MSYNKLTSLRANIEAIETAVRLRMLGKVATEAEKEILSKYTGFGGIKEVLYIGTDQVPENMKTDIGRLELILQTYANGVEPFYESMISSIKASVLTAFYTPSFLIQTVANQIQTTFSGNGLKMQSFLEPSAGIGGFLPIAMPSAYAYAFEKDIVTGLILSALKDDTKVIIDGFETIDGQELDHKTFDVIASNIPFGNFKVFDADFCKADNIHTQAMNTIHTYFFVKALDKLNEGGILAFVAPRGIADAPAHKAIRNYIVNNANMITALRLPENLFMQTGGIEVGSDLFIFQKHSRKPTLTSREHFFLQVAKEGISHSSEMTENANRIFTLPHSALATASDIQRNQFGKYVRKYQWQGETSVMAQCLADQLQSDFDRYFKKSLFISQGKVGQTVQLSLFDLFSTTDAMPQPTPNRDKRPYTDTVFDWMKDGTLVLFEGQLGNVRFKGKSFDTVLTFEPCKVKTLNIDRANDYLPIREAYYDLSDKESDERTEQPELRERLNTLYDSFVRKWGFFHNNDNKNFILLDSLGMDVFSLELQMDNHFLKADIFNEPVAFTKMDTNVKLNPIEALASTLNYYGKISMDYLMQITDMEELQLIDALEGEIYYNAITDEWEHKGKFLSGNVVSKSKEIRTLLEELPDNYKPFAENALRALENVIPEAIPYEDLDFNFGERWVPTGIYQDFAKELFQTDVDIMYFDVNDTYVVSLHNYSPIAYNVYSVRSFNGEDLMVHALQDTVPEITKEVYRNGERVRVPDEEAIQEAAGKIQEIRSKYNTWLDNQPIVVRDELVRLYNERFNCNVRPHYDGSTQSFPDLSFEQFPYTDLYPSQKDAIWMIKQNGGGVCWHEVGAGKTMVMCVAAYEMKRLGLVQKPLIIGLKANVHEIADCFRKAYPNARLLYPGKEDFTPANRKELFSKIKNNNWDCIILTHDQFSKIPQSNETMIGIFEQELNDVVRSLSVLEESGMKWRSRKMMKGLETRQQNLDAELARLRLHLEEKKDDMIDFHSMGIDHIFVDECHCYKNLKFQTRHTRVAGIGNTQGSQRAMNLLIAIRDIQKRTGKDLGATFLSGTVVVNALTELYVLFKYLRPKELIRQRISCFDAWAAIFTQKTTDYELSVTGSIRRKERFRSYIKVPELAAFLREITDYRTAEMINLDVPQKNVRFLTNTPTVEQDEMIGRLISFAHSGTWEDLGLDTPQPENLDKAKMLIATDVARKMALDMRMLGDKFSDDPANKASRCAETVYDYYIRSMENKGTQFCFSDLSTYKPNEWNIYTDIKSKLIKLGIPSDEIQFIQTAKTERSRKKMIEDMNNGKIRVLFGSTTMLGTGVNAQKRAVAVHHIDIPWRPADLEQRNGRAVRKGNTVKLWGGNQVDIIIYGTEKTLDAYKFNLLKNKQMFISQINNGTVAVRRIDEDSMDENNGMNFAEFVAVLSGNTDLLNKAKLDNKIMQLEKEQSLFNKERHRAERKIVQNEQDIEQFRDNKQRMLADLQYSNDYSGERETILIGMQQCSAKEVGQELHVIAKRHRGDMKAIGSYMGLPLYVKSEYSLAGSFDRNIFFVEGQSGLKYKCGLSGALPLSYVESADYPKEALGKLSALIDRQQQNIEKWEKEIPTLKQIADKVWTKRDELETLKLECKDLQRKIDESLKEAEHQTLNGVPVEDAA